MTFTLNSTLNSQTRPRFSSPEIRRTRRRKHRDAHKRAAFRASASANGDGFANFSWEKVSRSIQRGSVWFVSNFGEILKKETGFDLEGASNKAKGLVSKGREAVDRFRLELVTEFVQWNKLDNWKEGPLPVNDRLRYQSLDVYPPPLHRC